MFRYAVLGSGSSGNSYIFEHDGFSFLIDAGFSGKELVRRIGDLGFDEKTVRCIFLTHDHKDHTKGAGVLSRKLNIPIVYKGKFSKRVMERMNGLKIEAFPTSHDSPGSVSYSFSLGGKRTTLITDTGKVSQEMLSHASESDLLFLEANYNEEMLTSGPYPYFLKKRILSEEGHLSNRDAISFLNSLGDGFPKDGNLKKVYFCHLSGTNNSPGKLEEDLGMHCTWRGNWAICPKGKPVAEE
jgi:phosphoribosyl 1,2-cyclic phosphodiesterase